MTSPEKLKKRALDESPTTETDQTKDTGPPPKKVKRHAKAKVPVAEPCTPTAQVTNESLLPPKGRSRGKSSSSKASGLTEQLLDKGSPPSPSPLVVPKVRGRAKAKVLFPEASTPTKSPTNANLSPQKTDVRGNAEKPGLETSEPTKNTSSLPEKGGTGAKTPDLAPAAPTDQATKSGSSPKKTLSPEENRYKKKSKATEENVSTEEALDAGSPHKKAKGRAKAGSKVTVPATSIPTENLTATTLPRKKASSRARAKAPDPEASGMTAKASKRAPPPEKISNRANETETQESSQKVERRKRPWRDQPDYDFLDRENRLSHPSERQFFIGHAVDGTPENPVIKFQIISCSRRLYFTKIKEIPYCDCPDSHFRGSICKHIIYALIYVLKVPDKLKYQVAFLPSELREMLEGASGRFHRVDSTPEGKLAAADTKTTLKPLEGDCPVCFQALTPEENVVQCITSNRNIHESCLNKWKAMSCASTLDCVLCRAPQENEGESSSLNLKVPDLQSKEEGRDESAKLAEGLDVSTVRGDMGGTGPDGPHESEDRAHDDDGDDDSLDKAENECGYSSDPEMSDDDSCDKTDNERWWPRHHSRDKTDDDYSSSDPEMSDY